nr:3-oxoacyl-[acyl-carrier-protein] reductase 4-like [Tanacetum cinerariifolium]
MDERPSQALRGKPDSSMRVALQQLAEGQAHACVSAGNTGALMALSRLVLKTLPGIDRPAMVAAIPTQRGCCQLLDLGANVDCSAEQLYQFAVMGSVAAESLGVKRPKVALLNVGTEDIKGNQQVKLAASLLQAAPGLNYVGFVEGDGLYRGEADVVVCDGFVGNVLLKSSEGLALMIGDRIEALFRRNLLSRLAGLIARPVLGRLKTDLAPAQHNARAGRDSGEPAAALARSSGGAALGPECQSCARMARSPSACWPSWARSIRWCWIPSKKLPMLWEAVPAGQGGMAAILGLDDAVVIAACAEAAQGEVVSAVNFNSPGQVVIAGAKAAVERAIEGCKAKGAKRDACMSQGKVALVTGASRGIGRAIALELGRNGATVVGTATSESGAEKITAYFKENGIEGFGLALDVGSDESVAAALAQITERVGAPLILVNNAGITRDNLMMRMKDDEWHDVINTNLSSLFRLSKGVLRGMTKARWGRIISIGSVVGAMGNA